VHARIREEKGQYILCDEKSTAGTWVNYEQLSAPMRLRHGDIIQIGRFTYRFLLRKPPAAPPPKVTPTQP
jgi:pSer/pThr/pTyr-binding forkhead associated (FHA) protein